jgi:hypothetical protein
LAAGAIFVRDTQLRAEFAKTGTPRQAERIRLGLRGLAAFWRWPDEVARRLAAVPKFCG